jgi:Flp pilus assembly protein CpaB
VVARVGKGSQRVDVVILQNMRVLAVDVRSSTVTVEVSPDEAKALDAASCRATFHLLLRD